jgi:tetratricopeptide (TPR) repeat protein
MRIPALCSLIFAAVFALDARTTAHAAAWCADYRSGGNNCGFYSYEQCRAAVSGDGGSCRKNLFESGDEKPAARKERTVEPKPKRKEEKQRVAPAEKSVPPPAAAQPAPPAAAPPALVQQPVPAQQPANNFQTARALILSGKYEAGIAAMKSLGYDDHPDVASSIGFAHAKLGNLGEARVWYNKALTADPNHVATWGYSGALHVAQGDIARARGDLERIKSICGGTACREYQDLEGLIAAKAR